MDKKRNADAAFIYVIGITWLLFAIIFGLQSTGKIVICAILSAAISAFTYFVTHKKAPAKQAEAETAEEAPTVRDELQEKREAFISKMQELDDKIPDLAISAKLKQIEAQIDAIFKVVEHQPEKKPQIRDMVNYYLPTTISLLEKYVYLQEQNTDTENISGGMEKIAGHLDSVIDALHKQHDNLFEADVVDINADIRVMQKKLAADGLTVNQEGE